MKAQIDGQVEEAAKNLELEELLDRLPRQLTRWQAQRERCPGDRQKPDVFLFDDRFSNLDAKLRLDADPAFPICISS